MAGCNIGGSASPSSPVAASSAPLVSVATPAIACCAPTPPAAGGQTRASAVPSISTVAGTQATLAGITDSDVEFIRYNIAKGLSYSHGFSVHDYDGDGEPDILLPVYQGVVWLRNVNHGASWENHPIVQFTDPNWENVMTDADAGDVHHDGSLDVAFAVGSLSADAASRHIGGLYLAHMTGSAWTVGKVYQTDNSVVGMQLVDFDGSGYMDIVSNTEYQQNYVALWKNTLAP